MKQQVGAALRLRRRTAGLTLAQLAERAGCSESMISKIETGRVAPSLTLLRRLARALGLNLTHFFSDGDARAIVSRAVERPRLGADSLRSGDGVVLERLVFPDAHTVLQANIHIVLPGGASDGLITHVGEEMGFVLEGEIELIVGDETFRLSTGDSFHFRSERPHGYRNAGDGTARILWVNTPPTF